MSSLNDLLYDIKRIEENREVLTEKKINAIYQSLTNNLRSFIGETYEKYADGDGKLYMSYLDSQRQKAWFLNTIIENVDNIEPSIKNEITNLVNKTYEQCYKGMVETVKKADTTKELEAVTKDIEIQPNVLKQAVNNNVSKLTLPQVMEKHRAEIVYQLQQTLTISLMNGDRYEKMAQKMVERVNVSRSKAMNIARTETHRNIESGFLDCAENLAQKLNSDKLIYACTWRTMQDERVRPQQRRKTKKGWKTAYSKNGANHQQMEGQTVKVGELFDLGGGVKAKAPSQSGVASHDCNCRCFLEYNLMTVEEFAKATKQTVEQVHKKYNIEPQKEENVKEKELTNSESYINITLDSFPSEFTKGAEGKNTQKLIDYINNIKGADPNVLKLYASTGKLENLKANGITFKISHAKGYCVSSRVNTVTGDLKEVRYVIPKLKGDNIAGQVSIILHEQMHLLDLFGRQDVKKYGKWFSTTQQSLVDTYKNTNADISDEILNLFKEHRKEYNRVKGEIVDRYKVKITELKEQSFPNGLSPWEDIKAYKQYEKSANKLWREMENEVDYEARNIMGGGVGNLQDIYDALSGGTYRANGTVLYGHGQQYYSNYRNQIEETIANYASLSVTRPDLIKMLRKDKPELCKELDKTIIALTKKVGG